MRAQLETIPGVAIFEGHVEDSDITYANSNRIKPYIVTWPTPPHEGDEQALAYNEPHDRQEVTITVAAGLVSSVLNIASAVSERLHRVIIPGEGEWVRTEPFLPVRWDDAVTPGRHYLPMFFVLYS